MNDAAACEKWHHRCRDMAAQEKVRLLSQVSLFEPLSAEEIVLLSQRIPDIRLGRGQILYTPVHSAAMLYLLLEGRMSLYMMVGSRQLTLEVLGSGMLFGEAVLANRPQGTYAQALESSWITLVSLNVLRRLMQSNPEVSQKLAALLVERLQRYGSRMADIALKEVAWRLASLIQQLCETEGVVSGESYRIPTHYTHDQLGTMIGAKRVAITRAFAQLSETGGVELRNRIIHIRDLEALKHFTGEP